MARCGMCPAAMRCGKCWAGRVTVPRAAAFPRTDRPASELKDDTDLGARLVTVAVGPLPQEIVAAALACGEEAARAMMAGNLVWGVVLCLQGSVRIVRDDALQ